MSNFTEPIEPPPRERRWVRRLLVALLVLGVLGIGLQQAFPRLVEWYVRGKVEEVAQRLNRRITFDDFELEKLNVYHVSNLVISEEEPNQDRPIFTASRLTIGLHRGHLFAGRLALRDLAVEQPSLYLRDDPDGSSNYAEVLEPLLARLGLVSSENENPSDVGADADPSGSESRGDRLDPFLSGLIEAGMPKVVIEQGSIDLSEVAFDQRPELLSNLDLSLEPSGDGLAFDFTLDVDVNTLDVELLSQPINHLALTGRVVPQDDIARLQLGFGEPMELRDIPGFPDVLLRIGRIGFEYPYSFLIEDLAFIDRRTRFTVMEVPELVVALRELTAEPEDLYLSLVEAHGVKVYVEIDRQGRTNIARLMGIPGAGPLGLLLPPSRRAEALRDQEIQTAAEEPADQAVWSEEMSSTPSALAQEFARRRWWEIMPQTTDFTDVQFEILVHEGTTPIRTLDLEIPRIRASKRLYNFQMDVSTEARLSERGVGGVGSIAVEFIYYYIPEHWDLEVTFAEVDLGQFIDVMPFPNPFGIEDGQLNGELLVADARPEQNFDLTGSLVLSDFAFTSPSFDDSVIEQIELAYDFALSYSPTGQLTMSRGDLVFNGVQADILVDITELEPMAAIDYLVGFTLEHDEHYWARHVGTPPPWEEIRLRIDMPRQPVMTVFQAVPPALRRRVEGSVMEGEVGWILDARVTYARREDGTLDVEIPMPRVADVLDEGVLLIELPEEVDVRRVLEDFTFTFVDGIGEMRLIAIGPDNPRWTPLTGISPNMIASILNTEDQGFFESDGFNWLQMRRVIARYLAEQEFGRGASTITMQTVKNIFLSRERQISRKIGEMFLAYWMNLLIPKERILELYLNVIEFGPGINGISEAAEHYFGKRPADLTLAESTFLVSIVPNPRMYHFFYEQGAISDRWWRHMQRYLRRLLERELINEMEFNEAIQERPVFYIPAPGEPPIRPEPLPEDLVLPFLEEYE